MQPHSESGSDNDEGFFIPKIKVNDPELQKQLARPSLTLTDENMSQANDLLFYERPTDFVPRLILTDNFYREYPHELNSKAQLPDINSKQGQFSQEEMVPILTDKLKQKRYFSLKAKYQGNSEYQCVYSKIQNNSEFDGYIFSLENTTDYNPQDYVSPMKEEDYFKDQLLMISMSEKNGSPNTKISSRFDSKFECGNLLYSYEIKNSRLKEYPANPEIPEYDLIMQNDTNTKGYNQWFYFSYRTEKTKKARFNVINFIKKRLMFLDGVRPVGFSLVSYAKSEEKSRGWSTIGSKIAYKKSYITREIEGSKGATATYRNFYTLSFDVDFPEQNDTFYIAMNYPYTYTAMNKFIDNVAENSPKSLQIQKHVICHTISNNPIPCLTIKCKEQFSSGKERGKIVCLGRQHPGESVGSFVLQAFVESIVEGWRTENQELEEKLMKDTGDDEQNSSDEKEETVKVQTERKAKKKTHKKQNKQPKKAEKEHQLLKHYDLVVIPMVNPDGVIYGNFRTNLAGFDLNRQWVEPNRWLQPEIYFIRKYLLSLTNVSFCMDFHGHSKKLNSFIYSCSDDCVSDFRVFPWIFNDSCELFSIKDCTYSITPDKFRTARVNIFRQIKKPYVYTLETSFFGYTKSNPMKCFRFKLADLKKIGQGAAKAMEIFFTNPKKTKKAEQQVKDKSYLFDQWAFYNKEDAGSESNPSEDELNPIERRNKVMSELKSSKKVGQKKANKKKKERNLSKRNPLPRKKLSERVLAGASKNNFEEKKLPELEFQKRIELPYNVIKERQPTVVPMTLSQPKIAKPAAIEQPEKIKPTPALIPKEPPKQIPKPQKPVHPKHPISQQRKTHSNLLDNSGYLKLREEKMLQEVKLLKDNQQRLEIVSTTANERPNSLKEYQEYHLSLMKPAQFKYSRKNIFNDGSTGNLKHSEQSRPKMKEKIYIIKEHKVVNSFTRGINADDEAIKQKLEREINQRTSTLKKCQKMMKNMSSEDGAGFSLQSASHEKDSFRTKPYLKPIGQDKMKKQYLRSRHSENIDRGSDNFYL